MEEWYGDAEEWEASNTIEQDGMGRFTETWEQNGFKIVMTLDYFGNRVTMKQPGFELEVGDVTRAPVFFVTSR